MELYEFEVLKGQTGTRHHSKTITCASVRTGSTEVCLSISTRGKDRAVRTESVDRAIFQVERHHTHTLAIFHDQIQGKVLNKVSGIMTQRLAVQSVKHSMSRAVCSGSATVGLATLAVVEGLTTERTLVNLALLSTREW